MAKSLATLDQTSGGRFEWGIGYGWNQLEMVNRGLNPRNRMATLREVVLAVRQLWTHDVAGFDGEYFRFSDSWSWPKPEQRPHPPILLGARAGRRAFEQLVEFCDGWLRSVTQTLSDIDETLPRLQRLWADAGKDPAGLRLTFIDTGFWNDVTVDTFRETARVAPATLIRLRELGADRMIVGMPLFRTGDAEPMLDAVAELIALAE